MELRATNLVGVNFSRSRVEAVLQPEKISSAGSNLPSPSVQKKHFSSAAATVPKLVPMSFTVAKRDGLTKTKRKDEDKHLISSILYVFVCRPRWAHHNGTPTNENVTIVINTGSWLQFW